MDINWFSVGFYLTPPTMEHHFINFILFGSKEQNS